MGNVAERVEQVRAEIRALLYRVASFEDAGAMAELPRRLSELRALRTIQRIGSPQGSKSSLRLVA